MKNERLLVSFGSIDEKYVKEAEPKMRSHSSPVKAIGRVACFILIAALSLYLFIPYSNRGPDLTAYSDSEYFPIIERIADLRYKPSPYKNNFGYLTALVNSILNFKGFGSTAPPTMDGAAGAPDFENGNGSYVETTDNQVDGVIEADLMKRTESYIFRLARTALIVYSIEGDDSHEVARFDIPGFEDEKSDRYQQRVMYLSEDAHTVTIISPYYDQDYKNRVRIISIDVSDLDNIHLSATVSVDGTYNSSRMVDGKLLFISDFEAPAKRIDYDSIETFVPSVTVDGVTAPIKFEDIIYPDKISSTKYSVISLIDEDTLGVMKAYALLDFYNDIYVSESNVYVTKEYTLKTELGEDSYTNTDMTDIAVLDYTGDTLVKRGTLTAEGTVKDQYSMDEYEGHLRVVTSTRRQTVASSGSLSSSGTLRSASLSVFSLESFTKITEISEFAPMGETVSSVRFDGTSAYVCTAVIQTFTDPVFFFDLSDYNNITYTDTGVIEGFSSSLIELGDGYLLGIGQEDWSTNKIEVYLEVGGEVVSIDSYKYFGVHSEDYKAYFVDRDNCLFGFAVSDWYDKSDESYNFYRNVYVLLQFNGYELVEVQIIELPLSYYYPDRVRAFAQGEYFYVTTDDTLYVINIEEAL